LRRAASFYRYRVDRIYCGFGVAAVFYAAAGRRCLGFGGNPVRTEHSMDSRTPTRRFGRISHDEVVMRVKLEDSNDDPDGPLFSRHPLDTFDNQSWSRSKLGQGEPFVKGDHDLVRFDYPASRESLSIQTIYLEPLDTPRSYLPAASHWRYRCNFPVIYRDDYGSARFSPQL